MVIAIGPARLGLGCPCFLIAEIGLNHNGDMDLARKSIEAAAQAGANAVKFQNYRTEDFIRDRSLTYAYSQNGEMKVESQYEMFRRCELDRDKLALLAQASAANGLIFTSTPTGPEGVADLVALGAPILKNGSDFLGNLPLIANMARTGLPTILSTGMATLADIDDAVQAFRSAGGRDLVLLHCVSSYPAPMHDVHLRKIEALAQVFDTLVGFSDHTEGTVAAIGAVTLGACVIEKHFTLDRTLPGPDHWFSSDPKEFTDLAKTVRAIEAALVPAPVGPSERGTSARDFRLSCVAARDVCCGHVLSEADIAFARPGTGIPPKHVNWLIGARLKRNVDAGSVIMPSDLH